MTDPISKIGDELHVSVSPRQSDALSSEADDLFFGGAAYGGKSWYLLLFSAYRRVQHPGSRGLLLRRTFRELENSLIFDSHKIFPLFGATYNEQKKRWTFPGNGIVQFGYSESDSDVTQYQSAQYDDIGFDEASHFTNFQFSYISSRCRATVSGCKPLVRLASNPGGVGHVWLKKRYYDPWKVNKIWKDETTGKTLTFIPSKIKDNPYGLANDPGYYNRLKELPEKKFMALAEGSWDVSEGTFFEDWDERKHVLRFRRVPDSYTIKIIGLDWGFAAPACVLWGEMVPGGRLFIYRELYVTMLHPTALAEKIIELSGEEKIEYIAASPDIWGKKSDMKDGGETILLGMEKGLSGRIPMTKAMNARVEGWLKVKEWIAGRANDGRPWLQVSPNCDNLIRTMPQGIYDIRPGGNPEDMDPRCEDHAQEALRYMCASLMNVPRGNLYHPEMTGIERIFGTKEETPENFRDLPATGRGGY